jgi:hypothetical protein
VASTSTGVALWGALGYWDRGTYPVRCASSCMDAYSHEVFALKAVWFQNRLAFDVTAARPVTDTIPIAPGDVNAKLV